MNLKIGATDMFCVSKLTISTASSIVFAPDLKGDNCGDYKF